MLAGEEALLEQLLTLSTTLQDAVLCDRQLMFVPFMPAHPPGDQQVITDCMLLAYAQDTIRVQLRVFVTLSTLLLPGGSRTRKDC